jgi:CubicO group peptidase (beta-lactamase class C family)
MKTSGLVSMLVCAPAVCAMAAETSLGLPRSSPEEQGISSAAILRFVEDADKQVDTMNSFMLVRHGRVVAEGWWVPYAAPTRHELYSLSKSFTSTAVGMAIAEGRMTLDDPVLSYFPDDAPAEPSENLKAMRVRDLLSMSTGQHNEEVGKFSFDSPERLTRQFLAMPVAHKPGTHFVYNTPATYMLSAIVQKVSGMTVLDYLQTRLFDPLGIEHPTWPASAQGISLGGYGLSIRTEDIARFGQLYLQKGKWHERQLLPAAWVEMATARQTSNGSNPDSDWDQGYGYQFWRCRHGLYRGDGAFGQFCIVMPQQDAVVAITSGTTNMAAVMNLVWNDLLPTMREKPLDADPDARQKLERTLAGLKVRPQQGSASSPLAAQVLGKKFVIPTNDQKLEALWLESGENSAQTLAARISGAVYRIPCGYGEWRKGRLPYEWRKGQLASGAPAEEPVAATGAWTADDIYTAKVCAYETPYYITLKLQFAGKQILLDAQYNVSFGPTKQPQLVGRSE